MGGVDLEVTPYYMVRTPQFTLSGRVVTGSFKLGKIITDVNAKDIERVSLYPNKTMFVSKADNNAVIDLPPSGITDLNNINFNVTVPVMVPTQSYVYARIGVKVSGIEDMIFAPVVKVTLWFNRRFKSHPRAVGFGWLFFVIGAERRFSQKAMSPADRNVCKK